MESDVSTHWITHLCGGDHELEGSVRSALHRFLRLYKPYYLESPAPGVRRMARVYRAVCIEEDSGFIRSSEHFPLRRPAVFHSNADERKRAFAEASWDQKATFFSERQPPRRTRDVPSLLDYDGTQARYAINDALRQFEYMLNRDLQGCPNAGAILNVHPGTGMQQHCGLRKDVADFIRPEFQTVLGVLGKDVLKKFREGLEGTRLEALGLAGVNSVSAYNWLRNEEDHPTYRNVRSQAVFAYPFAWTFLSAVNGQVAEAVERATSLSAALANELNVQESIVKRMNGLSCHAAGQHSAPSPDECRSLASAVSLMPSGASPKTETGWAAYFEATRLARRLSVVVDQQDFGASKLLATVSGKWDTLDVDAIRQAVGGSLDMFKDVHVNVFQPVADAKSGQARPWLLADTVKVLCMNRSLIQICQSSAWWHDNQAVLHGLLSEAYPQAKPISHDDSSWPALHEGIWRATNGLVVECLNTLPMLIEEHKRMGHCINTYAPHCLYGGSHILSVRDEGGESLGTVEIEQHKLFPLLKSIAEPMDAPVFSLPPSVVQFQAYKNRTPSFKAWQALWEYVSALMTGGLEVDKPLLSSALEERKEFGTAARGSKPVYDTNSIEARNDAWRAYLPLMPKSVAKRGPQRLQAL